MTAAVQLDQAEKAAKHVAQHAAEKVGLGTRIGSRFSSVHMPNRTSFQHARAVVTPDFLTKAGRAAHKTAKPVSLVKPAVIAVGQVLDMGDVAETASRVTSTGKALFSVDSAGVASRSGLARTRDGLVHFAEFGSNTVGKAYPHNWLLELFETPEQRNSRINAQAVATVLRLGAALLKRA